MFFGRSCRTQEHTNKMFLGRSCLVGEHAKRLQDNYPARSAEEVGMAVFSSTKICHEAKRIALCCKAINTLARTAGNEMHT